MLYRSRSRPTMRTGRGRAKHPPSRTACQHYRCPDAQRRWRSPFVAAYRITVGVGGAARLSSPHSSIALDVNNSVTYRDGGEVVLHPGALKRRVEDAVVNYAGGSSAPHDWHTGYHQLPLSGLDGPPRAGPGLLDIDCRHEPLVPARDAAVVDHLGEGRGGGELEGGAIVVTIEGLLRIRKVSRP